MMMVTRIVRVVHRLCLAGHLPSNCTFYIPHSMFHVPDNLAPSTLRLGPSTFLPSFPSVPLPAPPAPLPLSALIPNPPDS